MPARDRGIGRGSLPHTLAVPRRTGHAGPSRHGLVGARKKKSHPKSTEQKKLEGDSVNIESLDRLQLEGSCTVQVLRYVLNEPYETRLAEGMARQT